MAGPTYSETQYVVPFNQIGLDAIAEVGGKNA